MMPRHAQPPPLRVPGPGRPGTGSASAGITGTWTFTVPVCVGILGATLGVCAVAAATISLDQGIEEELSAAGPVEIAAADSEIQSEADIGGDLAGDEYGELDTPTFEYQPGGDDAENTPEHPDALLQAEPSGGDSPGLQPVAQNNEPEPDAGRPLDDVRVRGNLLHLTATPSAGGAVQLCAIGVSDPASLELALLANTFASGQRLELARGDDPDSATWEVTLAANSSLGRPQKIGTFGLQSGQLTYFSTSNVSERLLPFCLLRLRVRTGSETDSEECRLWSPLEIPDVRISFDKSKQVEKLLPTELRGLPAESLRVVFHPIGLGDTNIPDGNELKTGKVSQVTVFDPELAGETLLTLHLTLADTAGGAELHVDYKAKVPTVQVRKMKATVEESDVGVSRPELTRIQRIARKQLPPVQQLIKRKVEPELRKVENVVKTGTALLGTASRTTTSSSSRSSTTLSPTERLLAQRQLNEAKARLDELVKDYEGLLDATTSLDALVKWTESTATALDALEEDARIGIQLIRQSPDGHRVVILRTSSAVGRATD